MKEQMAQKLRTPKGKGNGGTGVRYLFTQIELNRCLITFTNPDSILKMLNAIFPGSFDPPTLGHLDIIERSSRVFDELLVVVAVNGQKKYFFDAQERIAMVQDLIKPWKNVRAEVCDTLIVDFMKKKDTRILLRGVRGVDDFSYEFELSMMNKTLDPNIETLFMTTDPKYFVLRSSSIRELASFHGNISTMVPPLVETALKKKFDNFPDIKI
ncbi:pantetheine-phosphate adenylyltransferase [Breznakiellaceae bacterium SP9]